MDIRNQILSSSAQPPESKDIESQTQADFEFIVVGGGIAGVSAVEQILLTASQSPVPNRSILLISESSVVQQASKVTRLTQTLEDFVIVEKTLESFKDIHPCVNVVQDGLESIDSDNKIILTLRGKVYTYKYLCLCTGASPQLITYNEPESNYDFNQHILGLRDAKTVSELSDRVKNSRRILVIGNGGIATEFVYEAQNVEIVWAIKDKSISAHYIDSGAAEFLLKYNQSSSKKEETTLSKRAKYTLASYSGTESNRQEVAHFGSALGPDWHSSTRLEGISTDKKLTIEYETEIKKLWSPTVHFQSLKDEFGEEKANEALSFKIFVELSNGKTYGVDWVLSATGVTPNSSFFTGVKDIEGGICVNEWFHTSIPDVFAAGDVCCARWKWSTHWFQMRLWTQARMMGLAAGKAMVLASDTNENGPNYTPSENELSGIGDYGVENPEFCFEIFTHVTRFFGFKVVLLGLFNGQGISPSAQIIKVRVTPDTEYVKVITVDNKVQGAVLIGDTGLDETFENLILNQMSLAHVKGNILDPQLDLEDYFD